MTFRRTLKQKQATDILNNPIGALYGGGRSGKTFHILRLILIRASKKKSRHIILRLRFNQAKLAIWYDTLPKVLNLCFPNLIVKYNKNDLFIALPNGSEVWFDGTGDQIRVDKILGREYSTIYFGECNQMDYNVIANISTRLAEKSGLVCRRWFDFNPPTKKNWTYLYFVKGLDPITLKPLSEKIPTLRMNPKDNLENISESYIKLLEGMPPRQKDRFLLGLYTEDNEGALWNYESIISAQGLEIGGVTERTVVAVDPAVTNNPNSDETGIIVASKSGKNYNIDADYTLKESTQNWALKVIFAFNKHSADAVVVETNQGGDLVENVLRLNGFEGRVIKVHAVKGKALRAEPVVALYEQGRVSHSDCLQEMESEMMEWVPSQSKESPNRIDAMVYAVTELSGADESFKALLELALSGAK